MNKIIMHYDMDAFYASVEIRDNPKLQGKPVIVGTRVVTTCNYEARKYGLHSAMSVKEAKKLCPKGIYLNCDKEKYYEISKTIQSLILKLSHDVEFIALDEGYIDISLLYEKYKDLDYIAKKFRERIYKHVKLTCSVGIGYNKLSAKIASEVNKPNGFFIIHDEEEFKNYVKDKNIRIIPGIGKKTQEILGKYGIETIIDLQNYSLLALQGILGHAKGIQLYENSLGIDNRKIEFERKNKSIGNETTLTVPVKNEILIKENLKNLFDGVFKRLKDSKYFSKTLTIKIRFSNRETIQKSKSLRDYSKNYLDLLSIFNELLEEIDFSKEILLYGATFSNLKESFSEQLSFKNINKLNKNNKIIELQDKIKKMEQKNSANKNRDSKT
ncbi:MAG: DNA polymerase IV [Fusobacteriaceae bacterium]|nr:DNA polymerase IV [Fusobacteriaceae bacterium]MBN2837985.1 DNA polymerase IV [Fusobacteriaceae bacterium]